MKPTFGIAWLLVLASGAMAQPAGSVQQVDQLKAMISHARIIGPEGLLSAAIPNAPYSADEITRFSQTLGDGTHIQREEKTSIYRDSQGRTRRETPSEITIIDPVAGVGYMLDPKTMTGRKLVVSITRTAEGDSASLKAGSGSLAILMRKEAVARSSASASFSASVEAEHESGGVVGGIVGRPLDERKVMMYRVDGGGTASHSTAKPESLGAQNVEGIQCEGTRITDTIAAGSIGNDRPIQTVLERWYSPELKTLVLSKRTDPRNGDETFRLTNIRRDDPPAALFQLPAGYQIAP